jgi:hypothetical protein
MRSKNAGLFDVTRNDVKENKPRRYSAVSFYRAPRLVAGLRLVTRLFIMPGIARFRG